MSSLLEAFEYKRDVFFEDSYHHQHSLLHKSQEQLFLSLPRIFSSIQAVIILAFNNFPVTQNASHSRFFCFLHLCYCFGTANHWVWGYWSSRRFFQWLRRPYRLYLEVEHRYWRTLCEERRWAYIRIRCQMLDRPRRNPNRITSDFA